MGKGKRFELDLKNDINEHTKPWVKAHRPDYSGSSVGEVADIMVVWQAERYSPQRPCGHPERHVAYIESKKRSGVKEGNRKVVMNGSSQDQSGLEELEELIEESPSWADCYVAIKFPNRELIVLDASKLYTHLQDYAAKMYYLEAYNHGARLTPSDNISMRKPTLDEWPSTQSGLDDHEKLLREIGVEQYDMTTDNTTEATA